RLCRQDSAWSEAGRPSGRAADQVRSHHKPYDCEDARPRNSADAARARRRGDRVKRREFITLLGGAATWPLAVRAQQGERMRRIGVLVGYAESASDAQAKVAAFREGLQRLGWAEGRNIRIDTRWPIPADLESMQRFAQELAALQPDLILSHITPTTAALLQQTRTIPIIFATVSRSGW